jgi:hypothetical protein
MRDVSRRLSGTDFRQAVQAVAALRHMDRASAASLVPPIGTQDEQRAFQLLIARLVVEGGVSGLAAQWRDLPSPHWREMLLSEIGQALSLWVDEGTIELLLAGLDDPDANVARRAVSPLIACLREKTAKERQAQVKTRSGKAALEATDQAAAWLTPQRRARIASSVTATIDRRAGDPKSLTWPEQYIELLGLTATRNDLHAIDRLESFRPMAGETRRSEFETLDPHNLPWPTSVMAAKKGIPPGTPIKRVKSVPTGLLDLQGLEEAIARIRQRTPEE